MRTIARFVTRSNPRHPSGWDMGIMMPLLSAAENQKLQPNKVYEIINVMDQLVIKEVGDCCMDHPEIREPWMPALTWESSISQILCCISNLFMLTIEELIDWKNARKEEL
jgi:hypothetical protein